MIGRPILVLRAYATMGNEASFPEAPRDETPRRAARPAKGDPRACLVVPPADLHRLYVALAGIERTLVGNKFDKGDNEADLLAWKAVVDEVHNAHRDCTWDALRHWDPAEFNFRGTFSCMRVDNVASRVLNDMDEAAYPGTVKPAERLETGRLARALAAARD